LSYNPKNFIPVFKKVITTTPSNSTKQVETIVRGFREVGEGKQRYDSAPQ
jgi:hypothetical protein